MSDHRPDGKRSGVAPHAFVAFGGVLAIGLIALIAVCLCTHPFDTPLHHGYGQVFHALVWRAVGASYEDEWNTYTGVVRYWNNSGVLKHREQYTDGERDGVWIDYNDDGSVKRVCEYRDGCPWNGICNIHHMKNGLAEYRDGQPWNGVTWRHDPAMSASVDQFWVDGREVTKADFDKAPDFSPAQWRYPVGVTVPAD